MEWKNESREGKERIASYQLALHASHPHPDPLPTGEREKKPKVNNLRYMLRTLTPILFQRERERSQVNNRRNMLRTLTPTLSQRERGEKENAS